MKNRVALFPLLACLAVAIPVRADLKLPAIFGDDMALQADKPVAVWGWAKPGEKITVSIDTLTQSAAVDTDGRWKVELPAHAPGGPFEMAVTGDGEIHLKDVVYGQVWLFSGQSNMAFALSRVNDGEKEVAAADQPGLRLFRVKIAVADQPADDVAGKWVICKPESAKDFSAAAYFMGRQLHRALNQTIGLIDGSKGSTSIMAWLPPETYLADRNHAYYEKTSAARKAQYEAALTKYTAVRAEWEQKSKEAQAAGQPVPPAPRGKPESVDAATIRYNAMIHPLAPFTLSGVAWYQGETDAGSNAGQYRTLLPEMIAGWRKVWDAPELPFLVVQISPFKPRQDQPENSYMAELREAQAMTATHDPHVGLAVTIDIGDAVSIHPLDKQDVGLRLSLLAQKMVYGKDVVASGPTYESMTIAGDKVRVHFKDAVGMTTADHKPVEGFALAGGDGKFNWAQGVIEGEDVILSSPDVPAPTMVRYAWADNPACNLVNAAGLPAAPFRTDDKPQTATTKPGARK